MGAIGQVKQMLDLQIVEFNNTKAALDDLGKSKIGSDMMVTVAPGIFAKGELKNNKELLINVGSDVLVEKDIGGAKKLIENQMEDIKKAHDGLLNNLQELILQAQSIEKEFEKPSENV